MKTDHYPWNYLLPGLIAGGFAVVGYGIAIVQQALTRRHEDKRRFAADSAQQAATYLTQVVLWRRAGREADELEQQQTVHFANVAQAALVDPQAKVPKEMAGEGSALAASVNELRARAKSYEERSREALSVLTMVAGSNVVSQAVKLLDKAWSPQPDWAKAVYDFSMAVRKSIGVKGDLDAFKVAQNAATRTS